MLLLQLVRICFLVTQTFIKRSPFFLQLIFLLSKTLHLCFEILFFFTDLLLSSLFLLISLFLGLEQPLFLYLPGFKNGCFNDLFSLRLNIGLLTFDKTFPQEDSTGNTGNQAPKQKHNYLKIHKNSPPTTAKSNTTRGQRK